MAGRQTRPADSPLRAMRQAAGLNLAAAAKLLRCSEGALSRWERGCPRPKLDTALRIVALYVRRGAAPDTRTAVWGWLGVPAPDLAGHDGAQVPA